MSLIGYVLKPLGKFVLIPLGLMAAASATDAAIHKKMFVSEFNLNTEYNRSEYNLNYF